MSRKLTYAEQELHKNKEQIESLITEKRELAKNVQQLKAAEMHLKGQQQELLENIQSLQVNHQKQLEQTENVPNSSNITHC